MIFLGLIMALVTFSLGKYLQRKTKLNILNPLLVSIILCIASLILLDIPFSDFNIGGSLISLFLPPATASLALSIYRQKELLKRHFLPIIAGCLVGSLASIGSVIVLCKIFDVSDVLSKTLIPKSVTTPIAMEISKNLGGIPAITVAAVVVTGILGNIIGPMLIRCFHVKDSSAAGIAIGTCSHAIGTTKALELGEIEGAMSGIAIGISGILTVIIALFLI
ncbi:MAG: LrgB family protein [Lachnospiraceae bacterium]|nr:LrgB family protein [Lachnospiraceae bacterium]